ncbi:efflux RND transporter periplasmic adaptor subunit [Maricurvus nonylphenolicus]|uniref:efflux RND transporter periplasmic adaptor subunit n=1 Tax=Maricurvus nonylphenolicus TaxID=1008307 RepID=UPI0036F34B21
MPVKPLLSRLLPVGILLLGIAIAFAVMKSSPRPKGKPPMDIKPMVDITVISPGSHRPQWVAGGTVRAAEQLSLQAQVSGEIIALNANATPGALLNKGEWLAQIDQSDFQLSVDTQKALLIQAESDLALERGQQLLAREEFELAGSNLSPEDKSLVLREPQIAAAQAQTEKVKADLAKAELDLQRARITMPFDGQLIDRHISRGSQVNTNAPLYDVVNTERFWLEVKVPRQFIRWLDKDSLAQIRQPNAWQANEYRQAKVLNIRPDVDSSDRQVKVILEIDDPLGLKNPGQPQLLVNDFVEVTLYGEPQENTFALSPAWIYNHDSIWWVDSKNELQNFQLDIIFSGRNEILVKGMPEAGSRIVTNRMDFAAPGLAVKPRQKRPDNSATPAQIAADVAGNAGGELAQ